MSMPRPKQRRSAVTVVVLLIGACSAPSPSQPQPPPDPPPVIDPEPAPDPAESEEFLQLIDAAERALADERLLTPEDDSAYRHYQRAMAIAPDHPAPGLGFERIVERFLHLAQLAIGRGQWARARSMIGRAAIVDAGHASIAPLRQQVGLLANAERLTLRLDRTALGERSAGIAAELAEFGTKARQANARVAIRAPSDADARWIYQQLSRSPGERRIRGEIEIGLPPQVTILILATTEN